MGDFRDDSHYLSIGACTKKLYNRKNLERFHQSVLFAAVKKASEAAQQKTGETVSDSDAGLANLITLVPALLEDRSKQQLKKYYANKVKSLPLKTKHIEMVLQEWLRTACGKLGKASEEYCLAFTNPEGIAESLRREVHARFNKYMENLANYEKRFFDTNPGVALWIHLPAYIEDLRRKGDELTGNSKINWPQWKRVKDVSADEVKETIKQAGKKTLEELKEWTVPRLIKWVGISLGIPAAAGGIYITLCSFLNQTIPVKPWIISIVLAVGGALAAAISLCIWISKRSAALERLHNRAQDAFDALYKQFSDVATQLCESNAGKLNRIMRGVLEERMHQWIALSRRRDAIMLPPPAAEDGYRSLAPQKQEQIKNRLEASWRSFIAQMSIDKPVLTQWESAVEKSWRREISNAVDSLIQSTDSTELLQKIKSIQEPLPLARYHHAPYSADRILLLPQGVDKKIVKQEIQDTEVACAGPGYVLVAMAYRSGSPEQYDFGEHDDGRSG
ncbi:MAG: hypothetical protein JW832_06500 [Deltaproteobacteria bacterium]|nr:hypothetical protein [Deltaproteobacteria bacterium]